MVVKGKLYLDGVVADLVELFGRHLDAVKEPSKRRYNALHALELPVPLGSDDPLVRLTTFFRGSNGLIHKELDSLDRRIIEPFANDVNDSASF